MNKANNFLKGTMILAVSMTVVKIIGSLNWIILSRVLGGEGIGLYQMGFPIYLLAITVSSAGIPVAISIITAEKLARYDYRGAKRVFHVSLRLLACSGLFFSLLVYFGAQWLIDCKFVQDSRSYYAIVALAPAVFFVTFLASFRGYLQGWQNMTPTAVSEVVEQLVRVVTMLVFADLFLPYGLAYAAGGASMGAGAGAISALLVLMWFYRRQKKQYSEIMVKTDDMSAPLESAGYIIRRLLTLALPVSLTSVMLPLGANIDLFIVPHRLRVAGLSLYQATESFGYLTGMAVPLVNLAAIFTAAMTMSLVPSVSESKALADWDTLREKVKLAVRSALIISCPCCVGLWGLAEPVAALIYDAPLAADAIRMMSWGIVFLGIHQISTGILQGLGHTLIPVANMVIACLVKAGLNWTLTANPEYGIEGAALATVCDFALAALLNMAFVYKYTGYLPGAAAVVKPVLASVAMGGCIFGILYLVQGNMGLCLAFAMAVPVYFGSLFLLKGITAQDLALLPFAGRFMKRLR